MTSLERRATDLQDLVHEFLRQFECVNATAANGPHAEMNMQELRTIEVLGVEGPQMMREMAGMLGVAVNSLTSITDGLEKKGLVLRQRSEQDRRIINLELTADGRQVFNSTRDMKRKLYRSMLKSLTEDEQEIFMLLFRKIARAGSAQLQKFATPA
jgi:DNA-binding MarR family transcriptional regulator